jgi:hypothetical protein
LNLFRHRRRGGERAGWIGESRQTEGRHQRLLRRVHHVEREDRILAANEEACTDTVVRGAREDRVLGQGRHLFQCHVDVGDDDLPTGVRCHVHVERRHMLLRREHVQDRSGFTHFFGFPRFFDYVLAIRSTLAPPLRPAAIRISRPSALATSIEES